MTWYLNNKVIEEIPEGYIGFIYEITNKTNNKKYVGKKIFLNKKTKYRRNKRNKHYTEESDWKSYTGSSEELNKDIELLGLDKFSFKILYLCKTKGEMTYLESREIFIRDALLKDDYYNSWVSCKVTRRHVKSLSI